MKNIELIDWNTIEYNRAWSKQEEIFQNQINNKIGGKSTENILIFCEHPHVYTIGKSGNQQNMLLDDGSVPIVRTNRGGDITYHGFGQVVGYPIFDIESMGLGLKEYIIRIEKSIISLLKTYGIDSEHSDKGTGVWVNSKRDRQQKICAIGVRSSKFITMHGFALNVNTDLSYFRRINPCGFAKDSVTSMKQEIGFEVDVEDIKANLFEQIKSNFNLSAQ